MMSNIVKEHGSFLKLLIIYFLIKCECILKSGGNTNKKLF